MQFSWANGILTNQATRAKRLLPKGAKLARSVRSRKSWSVRSTKGLRPHEKFQAQVVEYLRIVCPQCFVFAIPNEGNRGPVGQQVAVLCGLTPGMQDLCLLAPVGSAGSAQHWEPYFIELKVPPDDLSPMQQAVHIEMMRLGIHHASARSTHGLSDVINALDYWRIGRRDSPRAA